MTVLHIICLTSKGGLPLFNRKRGDSEPLSFSVGASLNGVDMYGTSQSIRIQSTSTSDNTVVWSEFEDSIKLIATGSETSEDVLRQLLTSVFHAMVMIVGIQTLREPRNVDSLKRDLRACFPLIDQLMETIPVSGLAINDSRVNLLGMPRFAFTNDCIPLQWSLDSFAESLDCDLGWLLVSGQVVVATTSWWQLEADERQLLSLLISGDAVAYTARDIPVFLQRISPTVPFRLVSCLLAAEVEVCLICGPTPDIMQVEEVAAQCWQPSMRTLIPLQQSELWIFPVTVIIDDSVKGILLVDRDRGKYWLSRRYTSTPTFFHRLDVLQMFYYTTAATLATNQEAHWSSQNHTCLAVQDGKTLLCTLFGGFVPTHTARVIARNTLEKLTHDKLLAWA